MIHLYTKIPAPFLALLLGSLAALAMPPFVVWPILFVSFGGLYGLLLRRCPTKRGAFFTGWAFGFGYFLFSLSWIGNALLVEGSGYAWAWPLAVGGLPVVLSIFYGLMALVSVRFLDLERLSGYFGFATIFAITEVLRGHIFTGFPWNLFGYTWDNMLPILQILSTSDVYGLTCLTVLWCSAPVLLFLKQTKRRNRWITLGLIITSFLACYIYGSLRLRMPLTPIENAAITVVQPNIDQAEKWERDKLYAHFLAHIDLSAPPPDSKALSTDTHYIVWPETALNYWVMETPEAKEEISRLLNSYPGDAYLVSGMLDYDPAQDSYANTLVVIDRNAQIVHRYAKHHLVPFGEYIPFQNHIPLAPVTAFQGFERGAGPALLETSPLSIAPLICYEIIFPHKIDALPRPSVIINVTNDAWYGDSAGPHQHLAMARFRAIEENVGVIRAANTGFSVSFDPLGRVSDKTQLFEAKKFTTRLHKTPPSNPFKPLKKVWVILLVAFISIPLGYTEIRSRSE